MKDNSILKEVHEIRRKLWEESGGTVQSFFKMLRREEAKDKRPVFRRRAPSARKKERK